MTTIDRVKGPCPKCGHQIWKGPHFQGVGTSVVDWEGKLTELGRDRLIYHCGQCGWARYTDTLEQKKAGK